MLFNKRSFHIPPTHDSDRGRFIAPTADCFRSPCPGLNALANQGYLPRSGKNITITDLRKGLMEGFGFSYGFGWFMSIATFLILRKWFTKSLDLDETALHHRIEHSASLAHRDIDQSLSRSEVRRHGLDKVDPDMLQAFQSAARTLHPGAAGNVYTLPILAHYRVTREMTSPLDSFHAELARAELALIMQLFGKKDEKKNILYLEESLVADFFANERIPDGWKPTRVLKFLDVFFCSSDVRNLMGKIRKDNLKPMVMGVH